MDWLHPSHWNKAKCSQTLAVTFSEDSRSQKLLAGSPQILEVAKDMETREYREPLGVVAAICPFSE
jgi:acyl-CoA reductase-like NAD-dependent aldehyde dehydrogenase